MKHNVIFSSIHLSFALKEEVSSNPKLDVILSFRREVLNKNRLFRQLQLFIMRDEIHGQFSRFLNGLGPYHKPSIMVSLFINAIKSKYKILVVKYAKVLRYLFTVF
jgi:hypothetical protein